MTSGERDERAPGDRVRYSEMLKGGGSIISTGSDSAFLGNREAWRQVEESIPVGRSCYPEDLARAALFFASDDSKYITGANLMVDGGWSVKGL